MRAGSPGSACAVRSGSGERFDMTEDRPAIAQAMRYRHQLAPLPPDAPRPRWSVMIPTYNCAHYLRETLASVLAQDPGPELMQIEVVDDASTRDDPEAVVAELGKGRVLFHRRPVNGGHRANFQTCLERSRGHLVHLLHGDDVVLPGFYDKLGKGFDTCPDVGAAFCRQAYINEQGAQIWLSDLERKESGPLEDWLPRIALRQLIQTPSIVVRREVYERLGLFDQRLSWVEDWEMWVRIAAQYRFWYESDTLALYRMHGSSSTSTHMRTGENLRDVRRAVEIIQHYLPPAMAPGLRHRSLEFWASDAFIHRIPNLVGQGDLKAAWSQSREALLCSRSPLVLGKAIRIVPRILRLVARRALRLSPKPVRDDDGTAPPTS